MQYSILQLMGFTALAAVVFWLVNVFGLPVTVMIAGVGANLIIVGIIDSNWVIVGAFWGGVVHAGVLLLVVLTGSADSSYDLLTVLYVVVGAYIGAAHTTWRHAIELSRIDSPAPSMSNLNRKGQDSDDGPFETLTKPAELGLGRRSATGSQPDA